MSIFLIAQTPRAGLRNHNLVIPTGVPILIPEVQEYLNRANFKLEGKNYIAVSQMVEQVANGRSGREILMLVGLDVEKLSNEQLEAVRSKLQDYLSSFATLVTKDIDWNKSSGNFIEHSDLDKWGQDETFRNLPQFIETETPVIPVKEKETEESSPKKPQSVFVKKNIIGFFGIVLVLMITTTAAVKQCTKEEQKALRKYYPDGVPNHNTPADFNQQPDQYDKYNILLPYDCHVTHDNKKALEEIRTLCRVKSEVDDSTNFWKDLQETDCNDKLLELSHNEEVDKDTFLQFVNSNKTQLEKLLKNSFPNDMLLDGKLVESLVNIRSKLRVLYNELITQKYNEQVCTPFFTDEDVAITSELYKKLKNSNSNSNITLASYVEGTHSTDYIKEQLQKYEQQHTFESLIEKLAVDFKNKNNAIDELKNLDYDKLKEFESKDSFNIRDLVAFISFDEDKQLISELFPNNPLGISYLKQVVKNRNTLRKLDTNLNGKSNTIVYLPFFTSEDAEIIKRLNTKLKGSGLKLADCLAKDICSPKYVIFKKVITILAVDKANKDNAIEELKRLDYEELKKLESLDSFNNTSDLVVLISDDDNKQLIYRFFGLDKNHHFDKDEQLSSKVVAFRNALRKLDAALNGNKPRNTIVYLPLFSNDDVRIIKEISGRLEKVELVTQK